LLPRNDDRSVAASGADQARDLVDSATQEVHNCMICIFPLDD